MLHLKKVLVGLGLVFSAVYVSTASAQTVTNEQLIKEVNALKAELRELRANQSDARMSEAYANEVRALVREVLADAETRDAMSGSALTAGHDGKFFLASSDNKFRLNIEGQIQFRYIAGFADGGSDEGETGFAIRRSKLKFSGHVGDPKFKYEIQLEVDRDDNDVLGDTIVVGYQLTDDLYIYWGETKAPFLREEMTSSKRQLAVERSYVNEIFTLDVVQGVFAKYEVNESVLIRGAFHDGSQSGDVFGSTNSRFNDLTDSLIAIGGDGIDPDAADGKDFENDETDFAVVARVDWLIEGSWKQWKDFTSFPGEERFITIGAAVDYEAGETGSAAMTDDILAWTIDGAFEQDGINLYAAYVGVDIDRDSGSTKIGHNPMAILVQGGYNYDLGNGESIEPFARWEYINFDVPAASLTPGFDDEVNIYTFGLNWYHRKHKSKFTIDTVIATEPLPDGQSGLGLQSDGAFADDQVSIRAQYQLLF